MPRYKNKVGKIIELPNLSGKEIRALGLRRVITVKDIESAGKRNKQAGGMVRKPKKRIGVRPKPTKPPRPSNSQPIVRKGTTSNKKAK